MGTESFRLFFITILFYSILADYYYANRQCINLSGLYTHSYYPSIQFALEQVNSQTNIEFYLNETEGIIDVNSLMKKNILCFF
jgi:hypothetical protein